MEKTAIRTALLKDYPAIYNLIQTAFETAPVSDGQEQEFVLHLRETPNYLPDLELVLEEGADTLIGHILLSKQRLLLPENKTFTGLLIAPLCISLPYRSQGYGGKLLQEGLRLGKEKGYRAAFVIGNPLYYGRFGFHPLKEFGIENQTGIPDTFVLAQEMVEGTLHSLPKPGQLAELPK